MTIKYKEFYETVSLQRVVVLLRLWVGKMERRQWKLRLGEHGMYVYSNSNELN